MANQSLTFNFHNHQIRIIEQGGEPWFVAADICSILGIKNTTDALRPLDKTEKARFNLGYGSPANIISESGLYKLVMRSDKPEAKTFQDWVTREVLPAIRKTGSYQPQPAPQPTQPALEDKTAGKYAKHPDFTLAAELAAKAAQAVFEGVLLHGESWLRNQRLVLSMSTGTKARPHIKPIPADAYIASMEKFTQMVGDGVFYHVGDLAKLAAACNQQLAKSMN